MFFVVAMFSNIVVAPIQDADDYDDTDLCSSDWIFLNAQSHSSRSGRIEWHRFGIRSTIITTKDSDTRHRHRSEDRRWSFGRPTERASDGFRTSFGHSRVRRSTSWSVRWIQWTSSAMFEQSETWTWSWHADQLCSYLSVERHRSVRSWVCVSLRRASVEPSGNLVGQCSQYRSERRLSSECCRSVVSDKTALGRSQTRPIVIRLRSFISGREHLCWISIDYEQSCRRMVCLSSFKVRIEHGHEELSFGVRSNTVRREHHLWNQRRRETYAFRRHVTRRGQHTDDSWIQETLS